MPLQSFKKASIQSLSDEVIDLLFSHLEGGDIFGVHGTPEHAMSLAFTNKRFLSLFSERITRIVPEKLNSLIPAHSARHLLSIARLAGHGLREVHLTHCYETIPVLSKACPNIEVLSLIIDEGNYCTAGLTELLLRPSFRSLTVSYPNHFFLSVIRPLPRELRLFNIDCKYPKELEETLEVILEHPPPKLCLTFGSNVEKKKFSPKFMQLLGDSVSKTESFEVDLSCLSDIQSQGDFRQQASNLMTATRENNPESNCLSIKLAGEAAFVLLKKAHPNASIQLTKWQQTYIGSSEGMFAKRLPLIPACLPNDVSKLGEIIIDRNCRVRMWTEKLENLKINYVMTESLSAFAKLSITVDILEVSVEDLMFCSCYPLKNVSKLHIRTPICHILTDEQSTLFALLVDVMTYFQGKSVWIEEVKPSIFDERGNTCQSRRQLSLLIQSVESFEKGGGKAVTVKGLVDRVLSGWSLTRKDVATGDRTAVLVNSIITSPHIMELGA